MPYPPITIYFGSIPESALFGSGFGIAQQFVTVINPKIPPKLVEGASTSRAGEISTTADFGKLSKPKPKAGETFALAFEQEKQLVASGISIFNPYLPDEQQQYKSSEVYASLAQKSLLPELFGHIVESKVPNADTTLTYFLSLHGSQSALFTDRADEKGQILFDAGGLSHWDRLIIQLEDGAEMEGLEIVSPVINTKFSPSFQFPTLSIEPTDLEFLNLLQKASAIEAYYLENYEQDSLEVVTGFVADHTFLLDDYTRFETVETVVRNIFQCICPDSEQKESL